MPPPAAACGRGACASEDAANAPGAQPPPPAAAPPAPGPAPPARAASPASRSTCPGRRGTAAPARAQKRGKKQQAPAAAAAASSKPKRAPKRPAGLVNLRGLIEEGLLLPAEDVLTVEYKGTVTHASLTPDGRIRWKDMFFESPSAFSIYLKRLVNPGRKADDGWKTVKYGGKFLEQYKMELLMRRYGGEQGGGGGGGGFPGGAAGGGPAGMGAGANGGLLLPPNKRLRLNAMAMMVPVAAAPPPMEPADALLGPGGAPMLRQLAPRGRGGGPALGPPGAAAGRGAGALGVGMLGGFAGAPLGAAGAAAALPPAAPLLQQQQPQQPRPLPLSDHTPRPRDLGSMVPAQHDFAPAEGELVGLADGPELPAPPGGGKHYVSGVELDVLSNGSAAPAGAASPADGAYTPPTSAGGAAPDAEGAGAAAGRPRRVVRAPERLIDSALGGERDGHDMVRCEAYSGGAPGSGAPGVQPYRVRVSPLAEAAMDFHAHLDRHEVIGLLAGSWDAAGRTLRVERAFPVREAAAGGAANDGTNVEMDPEDQFKVTEVISELYGLRVVGWYHSHPSFPALPSVIDIANQAQMQQQQAREPGGGVAEPYVAAIVSPYDRRLPGLQSSVTWFCVEQRGGGGGAAAAAAAQQAAAGGAAGVLEQGWVPMELSVERLLRASTPDALQRLLPALRTTALRYARKRSATNLGAAWRPPAAAAAAAAEAGVADLELLGTRLGKLLGSVASWWPPGCSPEGCKQFSDQVRGVLLEARAVAGLPPLERDDADGAGAAAAAVAPPPLAAVAPPPPLPPADPMAATSLGRALGGGRLGGPPAPPGVPGLVPAAATGVAASNGGAAAGGLQLLQQPALAAAAGGDEGGETETEDEEDGMAPARTGGGGTALGGGPPAGAPAGGEDDPATEDEA